MATYEEQREAVVAKMLDAIERGVLTNREALLHCYDLAYLHGMKRIAAKIEAA